MIRSQAAHDPKPRSARARRRWWPVVGVIAGLAGVVLVLRAWPGPPADLPTIQAMLRAGRLAEVDDQLRLRLARTPDDGPAWLALGVLRRMQKRDDEAVAALGQVRTPAATVAAARTVVGEIYFEQRRAAEAERAFREAVEADAGAVDALRRLVYLLDVERRIDEARARLWDLHRATSDPRHLITLVGMTLTSPETADPKPELPEFLARAPDDPLLRRGMGLLLLSQGRPAEARPHLEAAAASLEDDPIGRLALAECLLAANSPDAALQALGRRPSRAGERERWAFLRGRVEESRGRIDRAIAVWQDELGPDGQDRQALYHFGQALVRRGEQARARPLLERVEAIRLREFQLIGDLDRCLAEGPRADTLARLARLCREAGLRAEARAWYNEVLRLDGVNEEAQAALALPDEPAPPPVVPRRKLAVASAPVSRAAQGPASSASRFRFEEIAGRAGLAYPYDCGATPNLFLPDTMGGGVGLIDFDEDGWLDVYFVGGGRLPVDQAHLQTPNRLFRNRRDGTFEDATERAGVAGRGYGMGCAVADYDRDGHDDLFVTGLERTVLYRNRGDGTFEDVTERAGVSSRRWTTAAGFGDLDGDGDLDLVVATYVEVDPANVPDCRDPTGQPEHCPPGRFRPQTDHLFRNNGDGTFTDVGPEAGFDVPGGLGLGLAIVDIDEDGRLDIFVANDAAPNFLFHNEGALRFKEVAVTAGLAYDGSGRATASMGVIAEDLDGDARVDLFHTNFLNEPNTLHQNLGNGLFQDGTQYAGLDAPSRPVTGFGTAALDVDNDGLLDLAVANGHVDHRPWAGHPMAQLPHLYRARKPGQFDLAPPSVASYFARPVVGRGLAAGDLDNDGRVDLVIVHRDAPAALLRNVTEGGHWLGLRLRGRAPATPIGARVACTVGGRTAVRWLTSGTSYLSQNDPRLWFGLGPAQTVDRLEVRWPSGSVQSWEGLPGDRLLELREGDNPVPARTAGARPSVER